MRILLLVGIVLLIVGTIVFFNASTTLGECQTMLGQLGRLLSASASQQCEQASTLKTVGGAAAVTGAILAVIGIFKKPI